MKSNFAIRFLLALLLSLADSASCLAAKPEYAPVAAKEIQARDGLGNVLAKLEAGREVKIAYLGGSITAAAGWRVQTLAWFQPNSSPRPR